MSLAKQTGREEFCQNLIPKSVKEGNWGGSQDMSGVQDSDADACVSHLFRGGKQQTSNSLFLYLSLSGICTSLEFFVFWEVFTSALYICLHMYDHLTLEKHDFLILYLSKGVNSVILLSPDYIFFFYKSIHIITYVESVNTFATCVDWCLEVTTSP